MDWVKYANISFSEMYVGYVFVTQLTFLFIFLRFSLFSVIFRYLLFILPYLSLSSVISYISSLYLPLSTLYSTYLPLSSPIFSLSSLYIPFISVIFFLSFHISTYVSLSSVLFRSLFVYLPFRFYRHCPSLIFSVTPNYTQQLFQTPQMKYSTLYVYVHVQSI